MIPAFKKRTYEKACEICPEIVRRESHTLVFLRYCDYDVWSAAERLVQYWEDRRALFGDRAFLPMTQTGDGALTSDDLVALHAGSFVFLPPSRTSGQQAVFVDRTRVLQNYSRHERLRCLFYMFHVLSEQEQSQTRGILLIILLVQPRAVDFDHELVRSAIAMMRRSFPVKVQFHILNSLPKGGKRTMVQQIIQSAVRYVMEHFQDDWEVHVEERPGELVSVMKRLGIPETGIPARIGGSWKYEEFTKWCRQRALHERATDINMSSQQSAATGDESATSTVQGNQSTSVGSNKNERKRLVNVIHSRQKRERRKAEHILLEQEARAMTHKRTLLLEENERLGELLSKAKAIIANFESNNVANPTNPNSLLARGTRDMDSVMRGQNSISRFQETALSLLRRSPEEQNLILALLLQRNPLVRQQLSLQIAEQHTRPTQSQLSEALAVHQDPLNRTLHPVIALIDSGNVREQLELWQTLLRNRQQLEHELQQSNDLVRLLLSRIQK